MWVEFETMIKPTFFMKCGLFVSLELFFVTHKLTEIMSEGDYFSLFSGLLRACLFYKKGAVMTNGDFQS